VFAEGYAAKVGILRYRNRDGSVTREFVPEETLSDPAYLATVAACALTYTHPKADVSPDNFGEVGTGNLGEEVVFDNGFVRVKVIARRKDAIQAMDDGVRELSCGYTCEIDPTPGTHPEFGEYDAIQRNRRNNHVALVPRGRAGPEVGIRVDAEEIMNPNLMIVLPVPAGIAAQIGAIRAIVEGTTGPLVHDLPCHLTLLDLGAGHSPEEIEDAKALLAGFIDDMSPIRVWPCGLTGVMGEEPTPEIAVQVEEWRLHEVNEHLIRRFAHLVRIKQPEHYKAHIGLGYMADNDEAKIAAAITAQYPDYIQAPWTLAGVELWNGSEVLSTLAMIGERNDSDEDEYPNEHAARMVEPEEFETFARKEITPGITLVLGKRKGATEMETQAVRFAKEKFTEEQAQAWLEKHAMKPIKFEAAEDKLDAWLNAHPDERADAMTVTDLLDKLYDRIGTLKTQLADAIKAHSVSVTEKDAMQKAIDELSAKCAEMEKKLTPEAVKSDRLAWESERAPFVVMAQKNKIDHAGLDTPDLKRKLARHFEPELRADASQDMISGVLLAMSKSSGGSPWSKLSPETFDARDNAPKPRISEPRKDAEPFDPTGISRYNTKSPA